MQPIPVQHSFLWEYVRTVLEGLLFLTLVAGWLFVKRLPAMFRSLRGASWPMVQGNVESTTVNAFAEQSLAQLAYSYRVDGERYSGYFTQQFADEQDAWDYVRPLKEQPIFVRYRPTDPEVSAVRIDDQNSLLAAREESFVARFFLRSIWNLLGVSDLHLPLRLGTRSWPATKARIETSAVTQERERGFWFLIPSYICEISYSYAVRGEYYAGHFQKVFYREDSANEFVDKLKGEDIFVRYKADSPATSVLRRSDQQNPPQA